MVFGFGKKKREEAPPGIPPTSPPTLGPPTDLVVGMRQQDFTNNQIVQALQRDGYNSDQIFDAMNQADMGGAADEISPPPEMAPAEQPFAAPEAPAALAPLMEQPVAPEGGYGEKEKIEELTEAIIEEKWSELRENINKIIEWKNKTEAKIETLEQKFTQLQKSFDELHNALIGKMGEYDKHVAEIGTDVKAMEKTFQKVLPTFTQNVNELSRIVKGAKKKKKS